MNQKTTIHPGELIVSEALRCVYCIVPKAACSNWIMLLRRAEGHSDWDDPKLVYDHGANGLTYLTCAEAMLTLDLDRYFKFTVVRHPLTRTLSAYRNKLDPSYDTVVPYWQEFARHIASTLGLSATNQEPAPITFAQFVRFVSRQPPDEMPLHWAPQTLLTGADRFPYDFIGRFESLDAHSRLILKRLGVPFEFPKRDALWDPAERTEAIFDHYYTPDLLRAVAATFADDLARFGYPAAPPSVPTPPTTSTPTATPPNPAREVRAESGARS